VEEFAEGGGEGLGGEEPGLGDGERSAEFEVVLEAIGGGEAFEEFGVGGEFRDELIEGPAGGEFSREDVGGEGGRGRRGSGHVNSFSKGLTNEPRKREGRKEAGGSWCAGVRFCGVVAVDFPLRDIPTNTLTVYTVARGMQVENGRILGEIGGRAKGEVADAVSGGWRG